MDSLSEKPKQIYWLLILLGATDKKKGVCVCVVVYCKFLFIYQTMML